MAGYTATDFSEYAQICLGYICNPLSTDGFYKQIDLLTAKIDQWAKDIEWAQQHDKGDKAVELAKAANEAGRKRAEFQKLLDMAEAAQLQCETPNMPDTDHFRHWHSFAVQHTSWAKASAVSGDAEAAFAHSQCVEQAMTEINRVRYAA